MRYNFTKPHDLTRLHDELLAAGLTPQHVEGRDDEVWITVEPSDHAAVTAVVQSHNVADHAAWREVRAKRNLLLRDCDWTDLPNSPVDNPNGWEDYRTALRDIPQTFATVDEIVWPTKPA